MNQQGLLISYRYDALDRLIGVEPTGSTPSTRVYRDGRIATQTGNGQQHSLMEAGGHLLAQSTRTGTVVVTSLLGCDQQGSVLHSVTGQDAAQHTVYTPYGGSPPSGGIQSLLGFNGEQPDPVTGCYLLGNGYRAYNPTLMRFNRPDNLSPFEAGGINPYAYCVGDPVNLSDPTGNFSLGKLSTTALSIAISVAAIALTVATLGSAGPLTGPLIAAVALNVSAELFSVASELTGLLAPDSKAGSILSYVSIGLAAVSFSTPYAVKAATKAAASRGGKALGGLLSKTGSYSVAKAARQPYGAFAKNAQRTAAALEILDAGLPRYFGYVKWAGRGVKGAVFADAYVIPYFSPPATGGAEQAPSTLDGFVRGDTAQSTPGLGQVSTSPGDFLMADHSRMQGIREF